MAKLNIDPIVKDDILEFLDQNSDFAFELKTLKLLNSLEFDCQHCGSYIDDNTKKIREFDIRASKLIHPRTLRLAVECKNLQSNFPLHICCVPREEKESTNNLVISVDPNSYSAFKGDPLDGYHDSHFRTFEVEGEKSLYPINQPVGKSSEQIGKNAHDKSIISSDHGIYERWAQALSSADDLLQDAIHSGEKSDRGIDISLILPILVVPDGTLWVTSFDHQGNVISEPSQANRCSYFVDRNYDPGILTRNEFKISHLEIVTLSGLEKLIDEIIGNNDKLNSSFPLGREFQEIKNIG